MLKALQISAGKFLSAMYLRRNVEHISKPCLIHATKPALQKIEITGAIIPSQRNLLVALQLKHGCL